MLYLALMAPKMHGCRKCVLCPSSRTISIPIILAMWKASGSSRDSWPSTIRRNLLAGLTLPGMTVGIHSFQNRMDFSQFWEMVAPWKMKAGGRHHVPLARPLANAIMDSMLASTGMETFLVPMGARTCM